MSQSETAAAAAALTQSILGEFAANGSENAGRMLQEMQGDEAPQPVASGFPPAAEAAPEPDPIPAPEPAAEPAATEPAPDPIAEALAVLEPQLDEEYQALLDEPDFDAEAAAEVEAEQADTYDETYDPEVAAKLRAQEKRIKWLEEQNAKSNRGKWIAEAKRSYPLLDKYAADELAQIEATSRRDFARKAAKLQERYAKMLEKPLRDIAELKAQALQEGLVEARQKAAQQWGLPYQEPAGSPPPVTAAQAELAAARANRAPLEERLKILLKGGA